MTDRRTFLRSLGLMLAAPVVAVVLPKPAEATTTRYVTLDGATIVGPIDMRGATFENCTIERREEA